MATACFALSPLIKTFRPCLHQKSQIQRSKSSQFAKRRPRQRPLWSSCMAEEVSFGSSSTRETTKAMEKQGNPSKPDEEEEEKLDEDAMRAAEIQEVIEGLQGFRQRIIEDATSLAKKVRAPKKQLEQSLAKHPDILKIDGHIRELEDELKVLADR